MERRAFLSGITVGLLAAPLTTEAQQAGKVYRIGFVNAGSPPAMNPPQRGPLEQGLGDLGYVEGRNLRIEYRYAEGKPERLPALAAELAALQVDVIVTGGGTLGALAAKQATRTLPIVFVAVGDPVASGLVNSLAQPGGNVTGVSSLVQELVGKCLEQLKQGRSEGQSGRCSLAARRSRGTCRKGQVEGSRNHGTGAGSASRIR